MKRNLHSFAALMCLGLSIVACSEKISPELPDAPSEKPSTARTITISTNVENQNDPTTKSTLTPGNIVIWTTGDNFSLLSQVQRTVNNTLVVTVDTVSAGVGIKTDKAVTHYVKYSGISVKSKNNQNLTSKIIGDATGNSYKVGVYNSAGKYQFAAANNVVEAQINEGNLVIPLVQSSSSAPTSNLPLTVSLTGIQVSKDKINWIDVNSLTEIENGSKWGKSDLPYEWQGSGTSIVTANDEFTLSPSDAGKTSAAFTGTLNDDNVDHYALYPYSKGNSISGTTVSFSLPEHQTYTEASFQSGANPMVGKLEEVEGGNYKVEFANLCGVLKLSLKGSGSVTAIEVTDKSGAKLWGNATANVANLAAKTCTATIVSGGSSTIILDCPSVQLSTETSTPFHIVVPAGAFSQGFSVKVTTGDLTGTKETTVDNSIVRSTIRVMPELSTDDFEFELPELNIHNDAVQEYFTLTTSNLSGSGSNYSSSFFDESRSYRPDQPNTRTISFSNADASTVTVSMATDAAFENIVLNTTTTGSSYTLRNFVPGNNYYYKVTEGSNVLTSGAFKATGQIRMIAVEKGFNIRDLGGWTGIDGNKVRYENIYRGASLGGTDRYGTTSDITDEDRAELKRIGMAAQLDLRAATNSGKYSGEYSYHSYSRGETTLADADFNNTMTDYGAYNQDASVVADVAWIIYELKRGKPVYFNCRQGADRTGTIAFIIEGLLGCYGSDSGRQMGMDYELTGFSQANLVDNKTVDTSYRGASEAATNTSKLFYQLLNLTASGYSFNDLHEKCYYYLNRYWTNRTESGSSTNTVTLNIDKADLDWFINYMLGVTDIDGNLTDGHTTKISAPSWAATGGDLKTVAESKVNVISYVK